MGYPLTMLKLKIPEPISCGLFLTYKCDSRCRHCMYACSPQWKADWIREEDAEKILKLLANNIKASNFGPEKISINYGLHFTGGEPFLNFNLLLKVIKIAYELNIPSTFVETNCSWAVNDKITQEKLLQLRSAGLCGILVSVNPFILEYVPFEYTERVVEIGRKIFKEELIIYQEFFYHQFKKLKIKTTLPFEEYLKEGGIQTLNYVELLPMGRSVYELSYLFRKYPARKFFGVSCKPELTRPWHAHIDNYGNYITGYCAGISLGNIKSDGIIQEVDLNTHEIIKALTTDIKCLYEIAKQYNYQEKNDGYISKCHICLDIRKHIIMNTTEFTELTPHQFYYNLFPNTH